MRDLIAILARTVDCDHPTRLTMGVMREKPLAVAARIEFCTWCGSWRVESGAWTVPSFFEQARVLGAQELPALHEAVFGAEAAASDLELALATLEGFAREPDFALKPELAKSLAEGGAKSSRLLRTLARLLTPEPTSAVQRAARAAAETLPPPETLRDGGRGAR